MLSQRLSSGPASRCVLHQREYTLKSRFFFKKIFKLGVLVGGVKQRGCLLILKHLEGDLVASEARRVRESSEAATARPPAPPPPKGGPE